MGIRILHVATRHRRGGAERNLLHTISRELGRGFEVHVAVGTEDLQRDFPPEVELHPLVHLTREVSPTDDRRALLGLRGLIRHRRFEVVHTHQSKAGVLGRLAAQDRVGTMVHTVHMSSFGPAYGRARSAAFLAVERRLARTTDRFVFVGKDLRRRYVAAGAADRDRSIIIRSPIANLASLLDLRGPARASRADLRRAVGARPDRRVVLMVGALDRRKRQDLTLRALAPLVADRRAQLIVAGEGPEREALEELSRALGIAGFVHFPEFVADVRPFYAAADVLVQASTLEGTPQTVVQAIAAGVPVVATEVDGLREVAPDMEQVTVVPADGHGLLRAVLEKLEEAPQPPVPAELLRPWLPASVDDRLSALHDWLEDRAVIGRQLSRRIIPRPTSAAGAITGDQVLAGPITEVEL